MVKVQKVVFGSPAQKIGVKSGDLLISINGKEINDVLDYGFYSASSGLRLVFSRNGEEYRRNLIKAPEKELGLEFETFLIDAKKSCKNACVFCFVDQNPQGMRNSVYFKDDDERLSFLQGSYVTLTNLTDKDIDRLLEMHISPVNISVQTTNPELRVKLMRNVHAGEVLRYIGRLSDAGIQINAQLVLCNGLNDGDELRRSLSELSSYKSLNSVACVPAGLTEHRDGLFPLKPYDKEAAEQTLAIIDEFVPLYKEKFGKRIVYASDELFLLAGKEIPDSDYYEDYPQLENGVGMIRSFEDEFFDALDTFSVAEFESGHNSDRKKITAVTGALAYPMISKLISAAKKKFPALDCEAVMIENEFFGRTVTVSGLVVGGDIINQLKEKPHGDILLLPANMLRHERDLFLDGTGIIDVEQELHAEVVLCEEDGGDFLDKLLA